MISTSCPPFTCGSAEWIGCLVTQSSRGFCGDRTLRIATENGESGHESEREEKGGEEAEEEADEEGGSGEAAGGRGGEVE